MGLNSDTYIGYMPGGNTGTGTGTQFSPAIIRGIGTAFTQEQLTRALALIALLFRNGIPQRIIPFALTQILHETNGLKSRVLGTDNNYSGIKYVKQAGATQGRKSPEGNYYAHFATPDAWAIDFKRIISMNRGGEGAPINAADFAGYVQRLKANGYFGDKVTNYMSGMKSWAKVVVEALNKYKPPAYSNLQALFYAMSVIPMVPGTGANVLALPADLHAANDKVTEVADKIETAVKKAADTGSLMKWGIIALVAAAALRAVTR